MAFEKLPIVGVVKVLFVSVSVELIVGIVTSLPLNPPIHLSALTSQSNEPVSVASVSITYKPPSPAALFAFKVTILSPISSTEEEI